MVGGRAKHANIAFFVPHLGCPHTCSFCDQTAITGREEPPTPSGVAATLAGALAGMGAAAQQAEIAFFGGSFTAVDKPYRRSLLEAARPYLGSFAGIRISTRPDAVDREILAELKAGGVTAIELGAQSMDDAVLTLAGRGHTAADVAQAAGLIREAGFSLGLQMMTGLPGDTPQGAWATARALAALGPDTLRIYPALTLQNTGLEALFRAGRYTPPTLEETVGLCAGLLAFFTSEGIRVIRLGLHHTPALEASLVAGPHHPALRDLCEGAVLLEKARALLRERTLPPGRITLLVAPGAVGRMVGQRRRNLRALEAAGYPATIREDAALGYLEVALGTV